MKERVVYRSLFFVLLFDVWPPLTYILLLPSMKAMILAAGFGSRLYPLTIDRTKPAIPFLGRPLVGYVAEYLAQFGFNDMMVNLHHQPQSVMNALGDGSDFGVSISYSIEHPEIMGTAGAIANVREWFEDEEFLVINGKIISEIDIERALNTHRESNAIATMVLKPNSRRERFTEVYAENGCLTGFGDFPSIVSNADAPPLMFTGVQILSPRIFDYIPRTGYSDIVPTFYRPALAAGEMIAVHITDEPWYELSTIERYLEISLAVSRSGDVISGENTGVSPDSFVSRSVIWDGVVIESGARVANCVVGDEVTIRSDEKFDHAAIVRADMVRRSGEMPEKAPKGKFSGDKFIVPLER